MKVASEFARPATAAAWPRRALVGLWVLVFVLAGVGLAARWDVLVSRLARPPAAAETAGGIVR